MANILEFLRNVLVDGDAQGDFRRDPPGYLKEAGFGDLTGEDVAEAMNVLRRSLPDPVASGLEPFAAADGDGLPSIRPVGVESELDAAARVLGVAVDRCPEPVTVTAFAPPPPPATPPYDAALEEPNRPSWTAVDDGPPPPPPPSAPVASWGPPTGEPQAPPPSGGEPVADTAASAFAAVGTDHETDPGTSVDDAPDEGPAAEAPEASEAAEAADAADAAPAEPGAGSFGAALDAAVAEARQRHDEAIRQYTDASGRTARQLGERLDELIDEAQSRAGDITSAAEASVSQIHEQAAAARQHVEEEARTIVEQAHREAEEIRTSALADSEAARRDIEHRRAALRDAEEQLREKLSGIDSLFRQVLSDDDPSGPPDAHEAPEGAGPPP